MRLTESKKREIGEQLAEVWREDGVYLHLGHAAVVTLAPVLLTPPKDDELAEIAGCDELVARYIREAFRNRIALLMRTEESAVEKVADILCSHAGFAPAMSRESFLKTAREIVTTVRKIDAD
jgi:hypothetical protein